MAFDIKSLWARAKEPVLYTTLGALLILSLKQCGDGDKSRETNDVVRDVAENVDVLRHDTDTIKAYAKATYNVAKENNQIVNRTEEKVDALQETVDSCCDCNKKPVVRPRRPVPRDTVPAAKPEPCTPDTVVIVERDTVYADKPKDTNKGVFISIQCIEKTKRVR